MRVPLQTNPPLNDGETMDKSKDSETTESTKTKREELESVLGKHTTKAVIRSSGQSERDAVDSVHKAAKKSGWFKK